MPGLSTERLSIREFELSDAGFVVRLLNDEAFLQHIGDKGVRSDDDARGYLTDGPITSYAAHGFGLFHVAEIDSGHSVGMCGLLRRDGLEFPDIGYAFLPEYRSMGFAFESASAVLDYGHRRLNMNTIDAYVSPGNARSKLLLERLGLVFLGKTGLHGIPHEQDLYRSRRAAGESK